MSKYLDENGIKYMWAKTKGYVGEKVSEIENRVTSIYRWKGTVDTLQDLKALPEESLEIGDVYNVKETGMNYGWTGQKENPDYDEGWDSFGGLVEIPTLTVEEIDKLLTEE